MRRFVAVLLALAIALPTPLALAADPLRGGFIVGPANTDIPSYVVNFNVAPTVAMDVVTIQPTGVGRLRRIVLVNPGSATAAAVVDLSLGVAGGVGTGGTPGTAQIVDQAARLTGVTGGPDPSKASVRTGDTGLAGGFIAIYSPLATVSVPATAGGFSPLTVYDARDPRFKALTAFGQSGIALTFVLRIPAVGAGAANFRGYVEFTVTDA